MKFNVQATMENIRRLEERLLCKIKIMKIFLSLLRYPHSKCGKPYKTRVSPSNSCPDVPRMEHDFTGVVTPDVTDNEKNRPKEQEPMI